MNIEQYLSWRMLKYSCRALEPTSRTNRAILVVPTNKGLFPRLHMLNNNIFPIIRALLSVSERWRAINWRLLADTDGSTAAWQWNIMITLANDKVTHATPHPVPWKFIKKLSRWSALTEPCYRWHENKIICFLASTH